MLNTVKRINFIRLALITIFVTILAYSVNAWSLNEILANPSNINRYIGVNYDTFILLSYRPLLIIILVLSSFLIVNSLRCRFHVGKHSRGFEVFSLIITLTILFASIIIANYPYVIHRDAYLHGGVSEYVVLNGKYDPLALSRDDAYVSPQTFILYSVYSIITGANVISLEIMMTVLYPTFLVVFLYVLTNGITIAVPKIKDLFILTAILPTLVTHTIGVTLFHRYYMSILIMFCTLSVAEKRPIFKKDDIIVVFLLLVTLQFTHPITSFFTVLYITLRYFFTTLLTYRTSTYSRRWLPLALMALLALSLHIIYLWPPRMMHEAFTWLFDIEKLFKFVEVSYPVRVRIPEEAYELLSYFSHCVKWLWRTTLVVMVVMFLVLFINNKKRIDLLLSRHWFSLLVSTIITALPTISSFLWQLRALPYFGTATVMLMKEEFESINKNKLLKTLCIIVTLLSLLTTPIIHYERSYSSEMLNPSSLTYALEAVNRFSLESMIYGGTRTSIYYTYYSNKYLTPRMISIYDPVSLIFRYEVFESAIGKPIVLSVIDPEYIDLIERLTEHGSNIIYSSNGASVYIVNS
ncbi:MAG: hypothetical protein QXJ97_07485 [Desulfurococcaceae archaeon]